MKRADTIFVSALWLLCMGQAVADPVNFVPNWRSYTQTRNPADLVHSPDVAAIIGRKVDAINGQAQGLSVSAGASSSPRTLEKHFSDVVNVKDFGAQGDGQSDDTAALDAAFSYAENRTKSGSVAVVMPMGTYLTTHTEQFTSHIADSGHGYTVEGDNGATILVNSGPGDVLQITANNGVNAIHGLAFRTTYTGNTHFDGLHVLGNSGPIANYNISDITCLNTDAAGNVYRLNACVHVQGGIHSHFDHIWNLGLPRGTGLPTEGIALLLDGQDASGYVVDNNASDVSQTGGFATLALYGHIEGIFANHLKSVYSSYGVFAPGEELIKKWGGNPALYTNFTLLGGAVTSSYFNARLRPVYMVGASEFHIDGNEIGGIDDSAALAQSQYLPSTHQKFGGTGSKNSWVGVDLINPSQDHVTNNYVFGNAQHYGAGIWLTNFPDYKQRGKSASYNVISGNNVQAVLNNNAFTNPVIGADAGVTRSTVLGNKSDSTTHFSFPDPASLENGNQISGKVDDVGYSNAAFTINLPDSLPATWASGQSSSVFLGRNYDGGNEADLIDQGGSGANFGFSLKSTSGGTSLTPLLDVKNKGIVPYVPLVFPGGGQIAGDPPGAVYLQSGLLDGAWISKIANATIVGRNFGGRGEQDLIAQTGSGPTGLSIYQTPGGSEINHIADLFMSGAKFYVPVLATNGVCLDDSCSASVSKSGGKVIVSFGGVAVFSIDSSGNVVAKGTVTQNGTP
ncbi:glycosyl hydrolase family 28-related protein [Gluconobacter cerinus]|uniref:glycosyl hydrolase family 28-related protein n=1 Tax=Gluconobacter cerinus TaxID=38307 RepID=UPI001B8B4DE0|nr:glycosyl hydrolase family 28-related protein [Gluconobacter cerinus]MBS0982135.1 hypothetical protein [Gluconobacter cerinus]